MLKNGIISCLAAFFLMTLCLSAQAKDIIAQPPAQDPPLTVSGVAIDKTDKNAVLARSAAIIEAKRAALQKLAERNMSPEALKTFKLPDDQTLSTLVQDFEITAEQLSATRYVATFTVRFRNDVETYVPLNATAQQPPEAAPPPDAALPQAQRSILVLPYTVTETGKVILWEDANAWLKFWQTSPPTALGFTINVPVGDINDMAAGSADATWSGHYEVLEKLRKDYGTEEVVLAVVNKSGASPMIDLYDYKAGKFERKPSLTPTAGGMDEQAAFRQYMGEIMAALQKPDETPVQTAPTTTPSGPLTLTAGMSFNDPARWMELQKRLSSVSPPTTIEITALSNTDASFTLKFQGDLEALKTALAAHGIALEQPVVEVGESIPGNPQSTQKSVYALQLVN
jgi:hypothetical protein